MKRSTANFVTVSLVTLGTLLFLTDRYVFTPRSLQRSILGAAITPIWRIPSYDYDRGFGPWVEDWTYSLDDGIPRLLQTRYRCEGAGQGISCRRCEPPRIGNMCFLKSMALPSGEYRGIRIIDGKFRVERGVGDEDELER